MPRLASCQLNNGASRQVIGCKANRQAVLQEFIACWWAIMLDWSMTWPKQKNYIPITMWLPASSSKCQLVFTMYMK